MSFVNVNLNEIPEVQLLPSGQELRLTIHKAELKESANSPGLWGISTVLEDRTRPDCERVLYWMTIPNQGDSPQTERLRKLDLNAFLRSFGITVESGGFSVDDSWVGKQGFVILKSDTYQGQETRRVDKCIAPR